METISNMEKIELKRLEKLVRKLVGNKPKTTI